MQLGEFGGKFVVNPCLEHGSGDGSLARGLFQDGRARQKPFFGALLPGILPIRGFLFFRIFTFETTGLAREYFFESSLAERGCGPGLKLFITGLAQPFLGPGGKLAKLLLKQQTEDFLAAFL